MCGFFRMASRILFLRMAGSFTVFCVVFVELFGAFWPLKVVAFTRNGNE